MDIYLFTGAICAIILFILSAIIVVEGIIYLYNNITKKQNAKINKKRLDEDLANYGAIIIGVIIGAAIIICSIKTGITGV